MDLREYEQTKFELAEVLRSVQPYVPWDHGAHQDRIRDFFSRLAEDRFNLVVAGRFSRGKTSLMNAILGTDRLPTGIRPLTSVITTVAYGSKEQAVIKRIGFHIDQEIPLEALPDYITEKGNSGNVRRIRMAEVQLPVDLLRRGFYFVDTSGLGSPILANTRTTEEFLPEADALVLVTSYESPLSEEELRTLRSASNRRIFVIVNKQDLVSPGEREDVLRYLHEQLDGLFGSRGLIIFSVSARDGLEAKQIGNAEQLTASGIPGLEEELVRFLIEEKSSEFLLRMCERIAGLVRGLPPGATGARVKERIDALSRRIVGPNAKSQREPRRLCRALLAKVLSPSCHPARSAVMSAAGCSIFRLRFNTTSSSTRKANELSPNAAAYAVFIPGNTIRLPLHTGPASVMPTFSTAWQRNCRGSPPHPVHPTKRRKSGLS
jgi:hypothetical protein